jgi:dihydrofolate reductase
MMRGWGRAVDARGADRCHISLCEQAREGQRMPNIRLYIATSLDGFVAEPDGGVGWLFTDGDYGYTAFFESVESLIMGRRTYEQILDFGEWPYEVKPTYVFTRSAPAGEHPHVEFVSSEVGSFVEELRQRSRRDIWLVGGAALVSAFRKLGLIDEYILSVHPMLLGDGIPLFERPLPREGLRLQGVDSFESGLVQLRYAVS